MTEIKESRQVLAGTPKASPARNMGAGTSGKRGGANSFSNVFPSPLWGGVGVGVGWDNGDVDAPWFA
jgi:hypothetical protein